MRTKKNAVCGPSCGEVTQCVCLLVMEDTSQLNYETSEETHIYPHFFGNNTIQTQNSHSLFIYFFKFIAVFLEVLCPRLSVGALVCTFVNVSVFLFIGAFICTCVLIPLWGPRMWEVPLIHDWRKRGEGGGSDWKKSTALVKLV